MATDNALNVSTGKPKVGGAIFAAPFGTAIPQSATTELADAYENVGFCSTDGLTNEVNSDTSSITAWGGVEVMVTPTGRTEAFKFSMIETNPVALAKVYGEENVIGTNDSFAVLHNNKDRPTQPWVFEILLTGGRVKRIVVPNGKITAVDSITYTDGDPIKYGVTLSAFPDDAGNTAYEHIATLV